MMGFCYAVQFTSGVVKVGRTANISQRIATYKRDANKISVGVSSIIISNPVDDTISKERELIVCMKEAFQRKSGEWFVCSDMDSVKKIFLDCDMAFMEVEDVKSFQDKGVAKVSFTILVDWEGEDLIHNPKFNITNVEKRALKAIRNSKDSTLSIGVIRNKLRDKSHEAIDSALNNLIECGSITMEKSFHRFRNIEVLKFTATKKR